jgi:hypothetical protein
VKRRSNPPSWRLLRSARNDTIWPLVTEGICSSRIIQALFLTKLLPELPGIDQDRRIVSAQETLQNPTVWFSLALSLSRYYESVLWLGDAICLDHWTSVKYAHNMEKPGSFSNMGDRFAPLASKRDRLLRAGGSVPCPLTATMMPEMSNR